MVAEFVRTHKEIRTEMENLTQELKRLDVFVDPCIERLFSLQVYHELLLELIASARLGGLNSTAYEHLLKDVCEKMEAVLLEIEQLPLEKRYKRCLHAV